MEDKDENPANNEVEDEDSMLMMPVPPRCNSLSRFDIPLGRPIIATDKKTNREACRMLIFDKGCFTREIRMNHMMKSDIVVSCAKNVDL